MKSLIRWMDWPLRAKIAALFVVASLLPLGLATWISIGEARERMVTHSAALLSARGDQLVQRLDAFHLGYLRSAGRISRLPEILKFCQARPDEIDQLKPSIRTLLDIWPSTDSRLRGVTLLDASGVVTFSTEARLIGVNLSYRKYVQEALRGSTAISDIHIAEVEVGSLATVSYLSPVFGPDQEVIGIVNVSVLASAFWDTMKTSNQLAGPSSYAVLFDRQGVRIGHTFNEDIIFHPGGQLDPAVVDSIVAENRFGEKTRQFLKDVQPFTEQFERARSDVPDQALFRGVAPSNGVANYGIARRLEAVPWTVFYMIPEKSIEAPIAEMTRKKTLFAGAIILVALAGGAMFATAILRPIHFLANATELIARGDLTARVPVSSADELGRLGKSFNAMASQIESQAVALKRTGAALEVRVQKRTAELTEATENLQIEIIERHQADEALRKSQAQLHTIVESLDEGVVVADLNGNLLHFNRAALDLHGYASLSECLRPLIELADTFELSAMDGTIWPPDRWPLARALRGEKLHDLEVRIRRVKSDRYRIFSYGGTLVHDGDGKPMMAVVTISDITDRKRAEEEIRQLNAELEQRVIERTAQLQTTNNELEAFSYSVSHDLRAPLRSLDGFSQALMEDCADKLDAEGKDNLRRIRGASQRMGQLIDDLLNLSRLTRAEMNRETIDLSKIAREVADELRAGDPKREANVAIADGLVAYADPRLLRIALTNLIGNAWKFTAKRPDARIELGCDGENGSRAFFIRDNGVGFDMAYASKLFGAFQRLHSMNEFPGTGIGLATVQRILHRHGGRIWADSAVGAGTTFHFTL